MAWLSRFVLGLGSLGGALWFFEGAEQEFDPEAQLIEYVVALGLTALGLGLLVNCVLSLGSDDEGEEELPAAA